MQEKLLLQLQSPGPPRWGSKDLSSALFPSADSSAAASRLTRGMSRWSLETVCAAEGQGDPEDRRLSLRSNELRTELFTLFSAKTK